MQKIVALVTDAVGTRTFAYDAMLDEISETITGLYSKTLTRTYTSTGFKGRKQGLSIDNVSHYSYGYDQYGRMDQLTIPSGSFSYTRLADSDLVSQMTRPNGITTTWSYEQYRNLITQVQNGTVSTYGYTNDAIGRRTSMSRSGSAYANPDTIAYTYNDRSELTGASSNVDTTYSYSYAYDPIGNRIAASEAGVPWTYTTNNLNQYTSATENNVQMAFSYDLDGSMTYRPVDATSGWTQIWNGENRMVETYKGNDRLTFKYDYMGRRVEKCVYSNGNLTSKTLFVYDGFKCVEELDGFNGNTVAMRHSWQPFNVGLDVILATADDNGTSYFLHDVNKNVVQKTSNIGVVRDIYTYTPYGNFISDLCSAHIGFSSEMTEIILHLSYYNYRYFSLYLGIWLKRDVIEENGGYNLYSPCFSSIFNYDELGLLNSTEKRLVRRHPIWTIKVNKAKKIAEEQSRSYPGQWNGSGDAYRHCIWSCEMAKRIGKTNAELFGDAHEETGNGNPKEIEMDKHNNQVGRMLSESACSCADACKQALEEGKLMKFDVDLRRSGEIDPDKDILIPTTPILLPKTTIDDFYNYH